MIPVLFPADAQSFDTGGLSLPDAVSCVVDQDVYGRAELTLQYPLIGAHFAALTADKIILVNPDPYTRPQPYRVVRASRPINGVVSFYARHLAYDMAGIPVAGFTSTGSDDALRKLKAFALTSVPFDFVSYYHSGRPLAFDTPRSLREMLVSDAHSFLRTYGGVLEFDRRTVTHRASAGADRGVVITYGRDLVDLQQEENIANTFNGAIGYWDGIVETVLYPGTDDEEVIQNTDVVFGTKRMAAGNWPVERIRLLNFTETFNSPLAAAPTPAQIDAMTDQWIAEHSLGVPEVSIRLKYADIGQDVRLRDTVRVDFALLGVQTSATVTGMTYDALQEIVVNIQIGTPREDLPDSILDASRLSLGTINAERIGKGSIGGQHLAAASVSEAALQAYAVTKSRLAALSVSSDKLEDGAVSAEKLASDLQDLLGYAEEYHDATGQGTGSYPAYFTAAQLVALSSVYSPIYTVAIDAEHDGSVNAHTHTIVDNNDGTLTVGSPDFTGTPHPFDMTATAFFRRALAAIKVASVQELAYATASDNTVTIQDANIRYIGGYLKGRALVTLDNGNTARVYIEMDAEKAEGGGICPAMAIDTVEEHSYSTSADFSLTFDDAFVRYDAASDLLKGRILVTMEDRGQQSIFVQLPAARKASAPYIKGTEELEVDEQSYDYGYNIDGTDSVVAVTGYVNVDNHRIAISSHDIPVGSVWRAGYLDGAGSSAPYIKGAESLEVDEQSYDYGYNIDGTDSVVSVTGFVDVDNHRIALSSHDIPVGSVWWAGRQSKAAASVVNYAGELHTGPYGTKRLDLTTRVYYADGSYDDFESSVDFVE